MKANKRIRDLRRRPKTWRFAIQSGGAVVFVTTWPMQKAREKGGKQKQLRQVLVARLDGSEAQLKAETETL